jgi:hypothetical protein
MMLLRRLGQRLPWLKAAYRRVFAARSQVFSIGLYRGDSPATVAPSAGHLNPIIGRNHVDDVPAAFVADPFALRRDGVWYLWYEVMRSDVGRGEIALSTSRDGQHWAYEGVVLAEPFHLSYPHVVPWDGEVFMIPEAADAGSIRLYRASPFPKTWVLDSEILVGSRFVDATVFRHGDRWWLFAGTNPSPGEATSNAERFGTLKLYGSDDLRGPWLEHPMSPIIQGDARIARPAGRVVSLKGVPIRFAQDCTGAYGRAVRAFAIEELTETTYRERSLQAGPVLGPGHLGWNRNGMHHIDAHETDDGWLAFVDGWTLR